jgi:hypothetical protein
MQRSCLYRIDAVLPTEVVTQNGPMTILIAGLKGLLAVVDLLSRIIKCLAIKHNHGETNCCCSHLYTVVYTSCTLVNYVDLL